MFCRLGLEGVGLDHSTFSKNGHGRFGESDLLRQVFETSVRLCITENLIGRESFDVEVSLIRADVDRQRVVSETSDYRPMPLAARYGNILKPWTIQPSAAQLLSCQRSW